MGASHRIDYSSKNVNVLLIKSFLGFLAKSPQPIDYPRDLAHRQLKIHLNNVNECIHNIELCVIITPYIDIIRGVVNGIII